MPGKIKVKVLAGRNLPVMDRSSDTTDAYVEIKFGNTTYKTDVCRKSLNPQWNSEWYKFEVEDAELQDEPLQIRLMDHDTYSANDAIGKVYINLNPLLLPGVPPPVKNIWTLEASINSSTGAQGGLIMTGWLPVYDTMHGIRGEVNIIVKVELFLDFNKFRQSSCGVTFFYSSIVPHGYHAQVIHGFVEELVIGDDPEYKWIDKIRTPRASNEARQTLFLKLSNEVQRKIGLKALDLGGNAVIGYLQNFDLEGESGIVARGIGTVVTLVKLHDFQNFVSEQTAEDYVSNKSNKQHSSDCSESDSSPRLLLRQQHSIRTDTSPLSSPTTTLGNKFPLYGENVPAQPKTPLMYVEVKPMPPRQFSVQSYSSHKMQPPFSGSSLSLSDDVIDENSLRMMLALEDMRGESQGNRLTRGLRNLRHLPQRVLRSRNVDSLDEESDLENVSIHSSTWSIVTSDTSSMAELQGGSFKRKRFRKKPQGEGIAAMLIRSVHAVSTLPLDSVREDRETPTPSPVNFIDPPTAMEFQQDSLPATISELPELPEPPIDEPNDQQPANKTLLVTYSKLKNSSEEEEIAAAIIPMISSSESDTSSDDGEHDDEDEDLPSESSTNYNILDDTQSLLDPSSPEVELPCPSFESQMIMPDVEKEDENVVEEKIDETYMLFVNKEEEKGDETDNLIESKDEDAEHAVDKTYSLFVDKEEDGESMDGRDSERVQLIDSKVEEVLNLVGDNEDFLLENKDEETIVLVDTKDEDIAQLIESKNEEIINLIESESGQASYLIEDRDEESINFVNLELAIDSVAYIPEEISNDLKEEEIVCLVESDNEEKLHEEMKRENKEVVNLIDSDNEEKLSLIKQTKKPIIDEIISSEFSSDVDSDRPASAIPAEYKPKRSVNPLKLTKPIQERQRTLPESLISLPIDPPAEYSSIANKPPKHRIHKQVSMIQLEEHEMSESSEEEYHPRKHQSKIPKPVEKKVALINFDGEQQPSKVSKKIERTDTVIYKGPKPLLLDMSNTDGPSSPTPLSPIVLSPSSVSLPVSPITDTNHLRLPTVSLLEVVPRTPYMAKSKTEEIFKFPDEVRVAEMLYKKYRRTCMIDLIKIIDSRMLIHQHHHSESTRRNKRPHVVKKNNTPSPDSTHRRHRSKSPELHHHHHHHHNKAVHHESTTRLHKHDSELSIVEMKSNHAVVESPPKSSPLINNSNSAANDEMITNQCVVVSPVVTPVRRQNNQQQEQQQQQQPASPANNNNKQQQLPQNSPAAKNPVVPLHRRSSDSDLSITPKDNKSFVKKGRSFRIRSDRSRQSSRPSSRYSSRLLLSAASSGNSLTGSDRSMGGYLKPAGLVRTMNQEALEMLEYPFITMQQYPPGFVLHIGGFVSARSVKLLERISNPDEPEGRDSWWTEIRMEVRSHARALACNVVIGYREETSICDDVCVLSGFGTAAVINLHSTGQDQDNVLITHVQGPMTTSADSTDKLVEPKTPSSKSAPKDAPEQNNVTGTPGSVNANHKPKQRLGSESNEHDSTFSATTSCSLCHLPYSKSSMNFQVCVSKCAVCRRAKVPDVLFTTVELPENIPMTGRGCFIQATVCKSKKDLRGELNAKEISDCLPFLEYEMHSLLLNKLRMRGMNAIFGLKVQVSIGERLVIGMAVGTAVYLTALPPSSPPRINANGNSWNNEDQLAEMQKSLVETVKKNIEFYQLKPLQEAENGKSMSDTDESEDELPELDLGLGMKDVCLLEVDDVEDLDRINLLMDERPPNDFHVVNTEVIPGLEDLEIVRNLQMFTQVSRAKIPIGQPASMPSKYFARLLQTVYFKLRRMVPCALCDLQFKVSMPEPDEIQLSVVGMALGLGEPTKYSKFRRRLLSHSMSKDQVKRTGDDNDLIFSLDEDHAENFSSGGESQTTLNTLAQKPRPRSPLRIKHTSHRHKHVPLKERYGVDITPLSYLPGGRIERYLGNLNFFFIRESNSIRENGGLSGFTHSFITEVLAIVRAHVTSLGGNAMVAFFMSQCVLLNSPHKNQGQCLINVGGDVVSVSYFANDGKPPPSASTGVATNC